MSLESRADGFAGDSDVGQEREALGMVLHPPRVRPVICGGGGMIS